MPQYHVEEYDNETPVNSPEDHPKIVMPHEMVSSGEKQCMKYLGHHVSPENMDAGHNTVKHPGFKAVQRQIASEYGGNMKKAGAILASRTRGASAAAKKANPRLKRVKG